MPNRLSSLVFFFLDEHNNNNYNNVLIGDTINKLTNISNRT